MPDFPPSLSYVILENAIFNPQYDNTLSGIVQIDWGSPVEQNIGHVSMQGAFIQTDWGSPVEQNIGHVTMTGNIAQS